MLSTKESIEYIINNIPELKDEFCSDTGLFTLQMATFARYTQHYIDSGDRSNTKYCFNLASIILRDGDVEVRNAVAVSYCEDLNLFDQKKIRSWAKKIMPANLLTTYNEVSNYFDKLFQNNCPNKN